jgi:hypothetical protein
MIATTALAFGLPLAAPLPVRADLPEDSCFVQAEAGASTATAVRQLAFRVQPLTGNDRELNLPFRYAMLAVVLAPRAPGDEVSGKRLTQSLVCRNDTGVCTAAERQASLSFRLTDGDRLTLVTDDMPVADYGESDLASNLAHPPGTPVRLDLVRANPEDCRNF